MTNRNPPYSGPPGAGPGFGYGPPPPPKRNGKKITLVGLGVFAVLMAIAATIGSRVNAPTATVAAAPVTPVATSAPGSTAAQASATPRALKYSEDVTITACAPNDIGYAAAQVVVTNHSSKPSNYLVTIAMESKDGRTQIGTGVVMVSSLAPGQSSPQEADALRDAPAGGYVCRIADITRYAA
ncbi:hypothetical protein [Frankia sp. Cj3]|uniref:hypothetical protein n=1 Tax=Frankia sp. Cj3 TaxID=2880976 RepID=UPI001EF6BA5A|nr:hypothetical protein [Frankia sp. Cj3]